MASEEEHGHRPPVAAILVIPLVVALALTLFAWPQANLEPRDVPLGVAGPPAATGAIESRLAQRGDAFDVHRYRDGAEARTAVEDRDVYGAIVAGPAGMTLLTAPAGSPAVAELLTSSFAERPETGARGSAPRVVEVVPADQDDPRGAALSSSVLPLVLAGIVTGGVVSRILPSGLGEAAGLVTASALAGLAAVAIAQGWLGVLEGGWLANAGILTLTVLAIASFVAGLRALLGLAGFIVGALVMVLIGNPWSGIGSAPELLPRPVGDIGQLLPPGAGGNALRSTAYFDGAGAGGHLAVLVVWSALGVAALAAAATIASRPTAQDPAPAT